MFTTADQLRRTRVPGVAGGESVVCEPDGVGCEVEETRGEGEGMNSDVVVGRCGVFLAAFFC